MALPFDGSSARRLLDHQLETVLIELSQEPFSSIRIDDRAGGQMAAEYLLQKGHRRCAFVGDSDVPDYAIHTSDWRLEGYRKALAAAGMILRGEYVAFAPHRPGDCASLGPSAVRSSGAAYGDLRCQR